MYVILMIFLVKTLASAEDFSDETKYIDLLPEKEKQEFLERVARRLFDGVQSRDDREFISGEVSEAQMAEHDDFVQKILKEESLNINRRDHGAHKDIQNEDYDSNLKKEVNDSVKGNSLKKKDIRTDDTSLIDLTFRDSKRNKRNSFDKTNNNSKIINVSVNKGEKNILNKDNNLLSVNLMSKKDESDAEDIQIIPSKKNFRRNQGESSNELETTTMINSHITQIIYDEDNFSKDDSGFTRKIYEHLINHFEKNSKEVIAVTESVKSKSTSEPTPDIEASIVKALYLRSFNDSVLPENLKIPVLKDTTKNYIEDTTNIDENATETVHNIESNINTETESFNQLEVITGKTSTDNEHTTEKDVDVDLTTLKTEVPEVNTSSSLRSEARLIEEDGNIKEWINSVVVKAKSYPKQISDDTIKTNFENFDSGEVHNHTNDKKQVKGQKVGELNVNQNTDTEDVKLVNTEQKKEINNISYNLAQDMVKVLRVEVNPVPKPQGNNVDNLNKSENNGENLRSSENNGVNITSSKNNTDNLNGNQKTRDNINNIDSSNNTDHLNGTKNTIDNINNFDSSNNTDNLNGSKITINNINNDSNGLEVLLAKDLIKAFRSVIKQEPYSNNEKNKDSETLYENMKKHNEYKVYQVSPDKPSQRYQQGIANKENPYYVPIYNYAPENAYYNPYNRYGPNTDINNNDNVINNVEDDDDDLDSNKRADSFDEINEYDTNVDLNKKYIDIELDQNYSDSSDSNELEFKENNKKDGDSDLERLLREYNNYKIRNQRKFRFGNTKPRLTHKQISPYKLNLPVVVKYPKYRDVILNPNDYLDMDYYFGRSMKALTKKKKCAKKKKKENIFPDTSEEGHPYKFMKNKQNLKDHMSSVRQLLYKQKHFGKYAPFAPFEPVEDTKHTSIQNSIYSHTPKKPETSEELDIPKETEMSKEPDISIEPDISKEPDMSQEHETSKEPAITKEPETSIDPKDSDKSKEPDMSKEAEISEEHVISKYPDSFEYSKEALRTESKEKLDDFKDPSIAMDYFFGRMNYDSDTETETRTKTFIYNQHPSKNRLHQTFKSKRYKDNDIFLINNDIMKRATPTYFDQKMNNNKNYGEDNYNDKKYFPFKSKNYINIDIKPATPSNTYVPQYNSFGKSLRATEKKKEVKPTLNLDLETIQNIFNLTDLKALLKADMDLEPYVTVIGDMVRNDAKALKQYDWLSTAVDIQAALHKMIEMTEKSQDLMQLSQSDLQLLKYIIYLHKSVKMKSQAKDFRKNQLLLPRNKRKKKGIIKESGLLNRHWLIRMMQSNSDNDVTINDLDDFCLFLGDLQYYLNDLHTAIKQISLITRYNSQRWFDNLKELYLNSSRKNLLELLLHITSTRLLDLVEDSAKNGVEEGFVTYVVNNQKVVERTKNEFAFVLNLIENMRIENVQI